MSERQVDDLLADLARHPGWEVLSERVKEHQQRETESLAAALLRGQEPLNPIELARVRGFFAGQRWMLRAARHELSAYTKRQHQPQ